MIEEYTYRFRLYPDKEQQQFLNIQFRHCRFVYNKLLEISKKEFKDKKIKRNHYKHKKLLPKLKQEYTFLKQANSQTLQETVKNLDKANKNFFKCPLMGSLRGTHWRVVHFSNKTFDYKRSIYNC